MVVNSYKPFWRIMGELWWPMLPALMSVGIISWLDLQFHFEHNNFPVAIVAILGTVIGLLLAFRTNSAYARWWETRILWGAIVNDSRTWVRQLLGFCVVRQESPEKQVALRQLAHRQIAWCYALCHSLRNDDPTREMSEFVDSIEAESYRTVQNVPNAVLLRQTRELRQLYKTSQLELYQFVELERTLVRFDEFNGRLRTH